MNLTIDPRHKNVALTSLSYIDDCIIPATNTSPSTWCTTIDTTNDNCIENLPTMKKFKKASTVVPSLSCFDDIYERAENFLENAGLDIVFPDTKPEKASATLKPCIKFARFASFKITTGNHFGEDSTDHSETVSQSELSTLAVPSFLSKRSLLQKSKSGLFPSSKPVPAIKSWSEPISSEDIQEIDGTPIILRQ